MTYHQEIHGIVQQLTLGLQSFRLSQVQPIRLLWFD
jgi:hypothetical protein